MADKRLFEQGADVDPVLAHRVAQGLVGNTTKNSTWQTIVTWLEGILSIPFASITGSPVQQVRSFRSPSTSDISNTSSTVYVATDLLVAITPLSASSKLIIEANAAFDIGADNSGAKMKIQKNIASAGWLDILYGNQTDTAIVRVAGETTNHRHTPYIRTELDSPGISDEIEFRVVFASTTNTKTSTYSDTFGMRYITVTEVLTA